MTADDCFAEALEVEVEEENEDGSSSKTTFRVYYTSPSQAKLRRSGVGSTDVPTNIDGRGASLFAAPLVDEEEEDDEQRGPASAGTIFMLHHGAGYSALSFALVAKHISEATQGKVGVLAYDCRGHGECVVGEIAASVLC
jgi:protein phosphatase methylesterase 1